MADVSNINKRIGQRIREKRIEKGLTLQQLADLVGVNSSTILRYKKGQIKKIKLPVIESIAYALNVDPAWLALKSENPEKIAPRNNVKKVPLLGTIAAGTPILAQDNIERHFYLDSSIKADFALRIKGDSMINVGINEGDIVFIRQQPNVENGEIGAVQIQDIECEATLKRVYKDNNSITLVSENPKYPPKILTSGNVRILGKLVAVLSMKE